MNKKLLSPYLIVVLIAIQAGVLAIYSYDSRHTGTSSSPVSYAPSQSDPSSLFELPDTGEPQDPSFNKWRMGCDAMFDYERSLTDSNIGTVSLDSSDPSFQSLRSHVQSQGMSSSYFDEHVRLVGTVRYDSQSSQSQAFVTILMCFGEYPALKTVVVSPDGSISADLAGPGITLKEITNTIPSDQAYQKLMECLQGNSIYNSYVNYTGDRLWLTGSPKRIDATTPGELSVDLETGACAQPGESGYVTY